MICRFLQASNLRIWCCKTSLTRALFSSGNHYSGLFNLPLSCHDVVRVSLEIEPQSRVLCIRHTLKLNGYHVLLVSGFGSSYPSCSQEPSFLFFARPFANAADLGGRVLARNYLVQVTDISVYSRRKVVPLSLLL